MLQRLLKWAETALLRHGTNPRTLVFLAFLSVFDGFVPLLLPLNVKARAAC